MVFKDTHTVQSLPTTPNPHLHNQNEKMGQKDNGITYLFCYDLTLGHALLRASQNGNGLEASQNFTHKSPNSMKESLTSNRVQLTCTKHFYRSTSIKPSEGGGHQSTPSVSNKAKHSGNHFSWLQGIPADTWRIKWCNRIIKRQKIPSGVLAS